MTGRDRVDVVEGNVDTKLALIPEPAPSPWSSRVSALEAVEEARASGHCEEVFERHAQAALWLIRRRDIAGAKGE